MTELHTRIEMLELALGLPHVLREQSYAAMCEVAGPERLVKALEDRLTLLERERDRREFQELVPAYLDLLDELNYQRAAEGPFFGLEDKGSYMTLETLKEWFHRLSAERQNGWRP